MADAFARSQSKTKLPPIDISKRNRCDQLYQKLKKLDCLKCTDKMTNMARSLNCACGAASAELRKFMLDLGCDYQREGSLRIGPEIQIIKHQNAYQYAKNRAEECCCKK